MSNKILIALWIFICGCSYRYYSYDIDTHSFKKSKKSKECKALMKQVRHGFYPYKTHDEYYELSRELNYPEDTTLFKRIVNIIASDSLYKPDTVTRYITRCFDTFKNDTILPQAWRNEWIIDFWAMKNNIRYRYAFQLFYNVNRRIILFNRHLDPVNRLY